MSTLLAFAPLGAIAFEKADIGNTDRKVTNSGDTDAKQNNLANLPPRDGNPAQSKDDGTAINIPGLGPVGVIPQVDFGMELLYGAENKQNEVSPETEKDDVQVRGTIKHRF